MKTTYIFAAILICSVIGALLGDRAAKTAMLITSGFFAAYGLIRFLG
jgi:hypothetical protein